MYGVGFVDSQDGNGVSNPSLLLPKVDIKTGFATAGVSSDGGCLRSKMAVPQSRLINVDPDIPAHIWLASIPLTAVLSASDQVLQHGEDTTVHIWGAGVLGSLFAWYLASKGCTVTVSDIYSTDSWLARSIESTGATYVGSSFDYLPKPTPHFGVDVTTEWNVSRHRVEACRVALISVEELDGLQRFLEPHNDKLYSSPGYSPERISEAVEFISTKRDDSIWADLFHGIYPAADFDSAIFPSNPTRFHVIRLEP